MHKREIQVLLEQGDLTGARVLAMQICEQAPDDIETWMLLGNIYATAGDMSEAENCYTRVVNTDPAHAGALYNLGVISQQLGRYTEAAGFYQKALQSEPRYLPAMQNLGFLFRDVGDFANALECFSRAIALQPDSASMHYHRAFVAQAMGHYEDAENDYRKATQLDRSATAYSLSLGKLLDVQGRFDEAMQYFRRVLSLQPDNEQAVAAMAVSLERQKQYQAAYDSVMPFIDRGSANGEIARAFASVCEHIGQVEAAINHIEGLLASSDLEPGLRADLGFSLGKLYDRTGCFDKAFYSFGRANELSPGQFSRNQLAEFTDSLIETYSAENMEKFPRARDASQVPVFVVGMPRSGTSLVEQILAAHPRVFAAGELPDIGDYTRNLRATLQARDDYPGCMHELTREISDNLAGRYLERLRALAGDSARVTNKMPHNFQCLGFIELLFPGARVIHVSRNPLDTCLSLYFQGFNAAHAYTKDLAHLGWYYRQYSRLMEHWRRTLRVPLLEIVYEELVAEQESVSRQMLDFCGLSWDRRCLDYHEVDRFVGTPSYNQVRRPIYSSSVGRWKDYEKYLDPLITALQINGR